MTKDNPEDGFSLAEMLVCLAILAIVLSVSLPIPGKFRKAQEQAVLARNILLELQAAQQRAIMRNEDAVVMFDLKRRLVLPSAGGGISIPEDVDMELRTASGEIAGDTAGYRFYSDGGSTGGRIVLTGATVRQVISVNWLTGVAKLVPESRQ